MSSMIRTIQRNNIKRLADLYQKQENNKVKKKKDKPKKLNVNHFDMKVLLKRAFKNEIMFLKAGSKIVVKENKPKEEKKKKEPKEKKNLITEFIKKKTGGHYEKTN